MPGYDGTGPLGQGALTGRGLGPCGAAQNAGRGFMRLGRGWGGRGRGLRARFFYDTAADQRCAELEHQIADLQQELARLREEK